jgi:predicted HTH transcriptional regulator
MYLAGYIERLGTETGDIIRLCNEKGLKEQEFIQDENFKTIIWRTLKTSGVVTGQAKNTDNEGVIDGDTHQATRQATRQADEEVIEAAKRVAMVLIGEMRRSETQEMLGLDGYFGDILL